MSVKPTVVPLFDTNLTNAAAPAAGRILDGLTTHSPILSSDFNYLFGNLGKWAQYLSDGDLSLNGLVLATTNVTLPAGTTNNWDPFSGTVVGKLCIRIGTAGTNSIVTGLSATGATDGRIVVLANVGSAFTINVADPGSLATNQILTTSAAPVTTILVPVGGNVVLRYDSYFSVWLVMSTNFACDWSTVTTQAAALSGIQIGSAGAHTQQVDRWITSTSSNLIVWPFAIASRRTIVGWRIFVNKTTSAAATITGTLWRTNMTTGVSSQIGSSAVSTAGAPGYLILSQTGLVETVSTATSYTVRFSPVSSAAGDEVYGAALLSVGQ